MFLRVLAIFLSLLPLSVRAAGFEPAEFKNGDAWTYQVTMESIAQTPSSYLQEYSVLWKAQNGNFTVGERKGGSGNAWSTGRQFSPTRCLLFIPDLTFEVGDQFCKSEVQPGEEVWQSLPQGRRATSFKGYVSASSPAGFYKAAYFVVLDQFGDPTAPLSTKRVWEFWFVPELRAFIRMRLHYENASGGILRTVTMSLSATTVRP